MTMQTNRMQRERFSPAQEAWAKMVVERITRGAASNAECAWYGRILHLPEARRERAINSVLERSLALLAVEDVRGPR